jgi:hypothetical protein
MAYPPRPRPEKNATVSWGGVLAYGIMITLGMLALTPLIATLL